MFMGLKNKITITWESSFMSKKNHSKKILAKDQVIVTHTTQSIDEKYDIIFVLKRSLNNTEIRIYALEISNILIH